jgi:DNA-binding LytR/AlgR family response regulator
MPTAVIADDEELQREDLQRRLAQAWPELAIIAACEDGGDALEAIARHRPDAAFLDIRMPEISGLDVARASAGSCHIVFTTAYNSHAVEAFDLGALDYLLKPLAQDRLEQAVARLRQRIDASGDKMDMLAVMAEVDRHLRAATQQERIRWISTSAGSTIKIFPIEEVLFFDADSRYTRVVSATDEGAIRISIRELQTKLDPERFWQINRGTLVCVNAIARAKRDEAGNYAVELRGHPEQLKVSQTYAWRFRNDVYCA